MEFRTQWTKKLRVGQEPGGPSMAKQSFRDECDINNLLRRYEQTGVLPEARASIEGLYGDFSEVGDYQSALNTVMLASDMFDALPAKVRDRFRNDPAAFVAFAEDPRNAEELVKLGLAEARKSDTPAPAAPVSPVVAAGEVPDKNAPKGASKA